MTNDERPIGYWLKELDRLLEEAFERALAGQGLARRHWQTMNALQPGPLATAELAAALRPFWEPGAISLAEVVEELGRAGWVTVGERVALSPAGEVARAAASQQVHATRELMLAGLSRDDYLATVSVLQRMSANLRTTSDREPRGGALDAGREQQGSH